MVISQDGKTALHVPTSAGHLKRSLEIVDPLEAPIGMAFREGHSSVVEVFIEMELRGELCHEVSLLLLNLPLKTSMINNIVIIISIVS